MLIYSLIQLINLLAEILSITVGINLINFL